MSFIFTNNLRTTLAVAASSSTTSLTLSSSAHLPVLGNGQMMPLTLNDAATETIFEIVYVTAISGAVLTVLRGQEGTTPVAWNVNDKAYSTMTAGTVAIATPSGAIMFYAGKQSIVGWLLCDGSAVSRQTYASLFSVIGTLWGIGDGSTTFNLPDGQRCVLMGSGGTQIFGPATTVGSSGGSESVVQTIAQMPNHSHGVADPGHFHTTLGFYNEILGGGSNGTVGNSPLDGSAYQPNTSTNTTGISIDTTGGGQGMSVMQPALVMQMFIKI
jgi:microcystin-dependent protein